MGKIGTGYVSVDADLSPFWRQLEGGLHGLDGKFNAGGNSAGRAMSAGLANGLNTGKFKTIGDSIGREVSQGVVRGLNNSKQAFNGFERDGKASFSAVGGAARQANADLKNLYAGITRQNISRAMGTIGSSAKGAGREIEGAATRGTAGLNRLNRGSRDTAKGLERLALASGSGGNGLRNLARSLDGFGGSFTGGVAAIGGLRIALVLVVPALVAFGGAAIAAGAALAPLIGLAAAAGNAVAGAAQGFGVFKLATSGIAGALKEQTDNTIRAGGAAATAAGQQRAAARAIQSAQDGVRNALEAVRTATRGVADAHRTQKQALAALAPALSEARMRLNDLREAVVDASLSLKGAKLAANAARSALADLLKGPSPRVLADAHQAVTDALRGEASAARALRDAHTNVTSALRGEDDAVQSLTEAHKALNELLAPPDALTMADARDAVADAIRNEEQAQLALNEQLRKTSAILDSTGTTEVFTPGGLQQQPTITDEDKARARLALADAENAVGDAARASQHAKEALAKLEAPPDVDAVAAARRRVAEAEQAVGRASLATADARQQVKDAELDVANAAHGTSNAREDLATLETPASADEIAKARLDVALAENGVTDATRDHARSVRELAAAEAKGVEGSKEVLDAREAIRSATVGVSDAERQLADAHIGVARATQALSDAHLAAAETMEKTAAAAANLNKKLDALPPAARTFVRELISMKPKLDELRQTAAAGFFPGATEGLHAAAQNFDSLNKVVGETSKVLGEATRKSGELVGSPAFGRDIETIGHNNAKVMETLGEALRHVISAIRHIMVAAGPLTQWLADVTNKWALNAAEAAKSGRETGKMAEFFEKTRAILVRLGSILGHLTGGLIGVGRAGTKTGNDIWASIDRAAKRFDEWANSAKGQRALQDFFRETKELAAAIVPVLRNFANALGFVSLKLLPLSETLKVLGPFADEATTAFISFKLASYGVAAASKAAAFATGGWVTAFWSLNAAFAASPITWLVLGLAAIAAGLIYAYKHSESFRRIVDAVAGALKNAIGAVVDFVAGITKVPGALLSAGKWLVEHLIDGIKALPGLLGDAGGWVLDQIVTGFQKVGKLLSTVGSWLKDQFTTFIHNSIEGWKVIGSWVLNRIVDGFKAVTDLLGSVGGWIKNRFSDFIHNEIDGLKVIGGWILNRIVEGFKVVTDILGTVGGWLKNRLTEFIHNEIEGLKVIGSWVLNRVVDGFTTITDALGSVGGWLKNRISDLIDGAKDGFVSVGKSIMNFIVDGLKSGGKLLLGFVNDIIDVINGLLGAIGVEKIAHITAKSVGLARGGVYGLAEGGAFARTAGFIDRPMVLMGEEAPRHPEYVIPTNPAYRDRAQMLLGEAANSIGLATGGVYSKSELVALWKRVNDGLGDANLMAAIALAESGGHANASNGPYHGLWQVGPGGSYDPVQNAAQAGGKLRSQGLRAWEAYTNGAYKQFMGGGGGILGAITGAIGDILSKGAGFVLDKLPGAGSLPDWLKGTGRFLLETVGKWIKGKVSDLIGLGGGDGASGGGVTPAIQGAMAFAKSMGLTVTSTTGGRHAANSWHYKGRAADVAGTSSQMGRFFNAALGRYDGSLLELFYDPSGAVKNGRRIPAIGGHSDHVHIALARGGTLGSFHTGTGFVPQSGPYDLQRGEAVIPTSQNGQPMNVHVYVGDREITDIVKVEIERDGRRTAGAWNAGVIA